MAGDSVGQAVAEVQPGTRTGAFAVAQGSMLEKFSARCGQSDDLTPGHRAERFQQSEPVRPKSMGQGNFENTMHRQHKLTRVLKGIRYRATVRLPVQKRGNG